MEKDYLWPEFQLYQLHRPEALASLDRPRAGALSLSICVDHVGTSSNVISVTSFVDPSPLRKRQEHTAVAGTGVPSPLALRGKCIQTVNRFNEAARQVQEELLGRLCLSVTGDGPSTSSSTRYEDITTCQKGHISSYITSLSFSSTSNGRPEMLFAGIAELVQTRKA
ncbi:hypothetical protein CDV31_013354 [Fusarium ambrosium]|uniref:Uncharacterized protein n=1 Tax=Fusarium ambrosium TaxID=131363 RepID=A0A428T3V2_9HYPO|nr:hypothetical protein CDV31_013354 [Fusarium ambrosium]